MARNISGATEYGACAARPARTIVGGHERIELPGGLGHHAVGTLGGKPDQLVEHDRRQRTAGQRRKCHQRVADVADDRGAAGKRFGNRRLDAAHDLGRLRIRTLAPRRDDLANPADEIGGRRHLVAKVRQLEVRVRVDQPRKDGHVAEFDLALRVARTGPAERNDPPAIDRHPAVPDGRLADRHEPPRTVADQWEMTRRRLPDWLRAG